MTAHVSAIPVAPRSTNAPPVGGAGPRASRAPSEGGAFDDLLARATAAGEAPAASKSAPAGEPASRTDEGSRPKDDEAITPGRMADWTAAADWSPGGRDEPERCAGGDWLEGIVRTDEKAGAELEGAFEPRAQQRPEATGSPEGGINASFAIAGLPAGGAAGEAGRTDGRTEVAEGAAHPGAAEPRAITASDAPVDPKGPGRPWRQAGTPAPDQTVGAPGADQQRPEAPRTSVADAADAREEAEPAPRGPVHGLANAVTRQDAAALETRGASGSVPARHEAIRHRRLDGETRSAVRAVLARALGAADTQAARGEATGAVQSVPESGGTAAAAEPTLRKLVDTVGTVGSAGDARTSPGADDAAEDHPTLREPTQAPSGRRVAWGRPPVSDTGAWFERPERAEVRWTEATADPALVHHAPGAGARALHPGGVTAASAQPASAEAGATVDPPVASQLVKAVSLAWKEGQGEAKLRLRPDHLGELVVTLRVEQGAVVALVKAETAEARERIQASEAVLREALAGQGLDLDSLVVTADPDEGRGRPRTFGQRQARPQRRAPDGAPPFLLEMDA